jgi:hypothetical protein
MKTRMVFKKIPLPQEVRAGEHQKAYRQYFWRKGDLAF